MSKVKSQQLFLITRDWALAADDYQWILQHRVGADWKDRHFVRSKAGIARCLKRNGVRATKASQQALDALPETWTDWVWLEYEKRLAARRAAATSRQPKPRRSTRTEPADASTLHF